MTTDLLREWLGRDPKEVIAERFDPIKREDYPCPQCWGSGREWSSDGERERICGICDGSGELRPRVKEEFDPDADERIPW